MSEEAPRVISQLFPDAAALEATPFSEDLLKRFEALGPVPTLIRRGVFHAHVDLEDALDRKAAGKPFYMFLSITPTDRLFNLRHAAMFKLAKDLQLLFGCPLVIHVLDTKACLRDQNPKTTMAVAAKMTAETIKDILAFGFDASKTVIIKNSEAMGLDYVLLCDLQRRSKLGSFYELFFTNDNISIAEMDVAFQNGCFAFPKYLSKIFPNYADYRCLMLLRPSQLNLFKFAKTLCEQPPMAIFGGFVPALQSGQKMPKLAKVALANKSVAYMTIYTKDKANDIKTKINKYAFSGGKDSREEQQAAGANLDVDIPFYLLRIFEDSDENYERVIHFYGPGELSGDEKRLMTGEIKRITADTLTAFITNLQKARDAVTPEMIQSCVGIRAL